MRTAGQPPAFRMRSDAPSLDISAQRSRSDWDDFQLPRFSPVPVSAIRADMPLHVGLHFAPRTAASSPAAARSDLRHQLMAAWVCSAGHSTSRRMLQPTAPPGRLRVTAEIGTRRAHRRHRPAALRRDRREARRPRHLVATRMLGRSGRKLSSSSPASSPQHHAEGFLRRLGSSRWNSRRDAAGHARALDVLQELVAEAPCLAWAPSIKPGMSARTKLTVSRRETRTMPEARFEGRERIVRNPRPERARASPSTSICRRSASRPRPTSAISLRLSRTRPVLRPRHRARHSRGARFVALAKRALPLSATCHRRAPATNGSSAWSAGPSARCHARRR